MDQEPSLAPNGEDALESSNQQRWAEQPDAGNHSNHPPPFATALLDHLEPRQRGQVEQILTRNWQSGRAQRVMQKVHGVAALDGRLDATHTAWLNYQRQVIEMLRKEGERLDALSRNSPEAWSLLYHQLKHSACRTLHRHGLDGDYSADKAADLAQQTCERIFASTFPCDIDFDLWTGTILKNVILQYLTRSQDLLDRQRYINSIDDLDDSTNTEVVTPMDHQSAGLGVQELVVGNAEMQSILDALEKMRSEERRAVIVYTYFSGLTDEEIATKLGRTKGVVQTLRHRALKQLRGLCSDD